MLGLIKAGLAFIPGWGQVASAGLSAAGWIWNHKALTGLILSLGLLAWYRHEAGTERDAREKAELQASGALHDLATVTANRDALAADNANLTGIIARQQAEADAADARAKAALKAQQVSASQLRGQLQGARNQTETLIQQIQEARHANPIAVSPAVVDDFDPLIRAGLERLKCVQRAANRGEAGDGCRVPLPVAAGGAGAAGGSAGAGDYRPGFDAQLRLLNDLWRLHDWGASCYADKRAIAATQEAAAQP